MVREPEVTGRPLKLDHAGIDVLSAREAVIGLYDDKMRAGFEHAEVQRNVGFILKKVEDLSLGKGPLGFSVKYSDLDVCRSEHFAFRAYPCVIFQSELDVF